MCVRHSGPGRIEAKVALSDGWLGVPVRLSSINLGAALISAAGRGDKDCSGRPQYMAADKANHKGHGNPTE